MDLVNASGAPMIPIRVTIRRPNDEVICFNGEKAIKDCSGMLGDSGGEEAEGEGVKDARGCT